MARKRTEKPPTIIGFLVEEMARHPIVLIVGGLIVGVFVALVALR